MRKGNTVAGSLTDSAGQSALETLPEYNARIDEALGLNIDAVEAMDNTRRCKF
jgi:hypothetical protein